MKVVPGRSVTLPPELPWVSQLCIHFTSPLRVYMAHLTLASASRVTLGKGLPFLQGR